MYCSYIHTYIHTYISSSTIRNNRNRFCLYDEVFLSLSQSGDAETHVRSFKRFYFQGFESTIKASIFQLETIFILT